MEPSLVSGRVKLPSVVVEKVFLDPLVSRQVTMSPVVIEKAFLDPLVDLVGVEAPSLYPLVEPLNPVVGSVKVVVEVSCDQMALSIRG